MKIGQKFNKLTIKEYFFYIDNHKKYTDFNTLGLYRSIMENDKLDPTQKIEVVEYANQFFKKTFDFLQLKDPRTYFDILTIGKDLTKADERQIWRNIIKYQQEYLANKKIKHRNFGDYSKHNCGMDTCSFNGLMIRQGSHLSEAIMHFHSDKNMPIVNNRGKDKNITRKIINTDLEME